MSKSVGETPARSLTRPRSSIVLFAALSACLAAGYGVLFTVVGDFRDEYGIGESAVGLVISIGFLAGFVSQLLIAPIADRGRARQLVILGTVFNVAGLLLIAFGGSFAAVLIGRVVSGLGIGAASPSIKRIVILSDPPNLGRNLGLLISADVSGFALGPAVSALLVGPVGLAAPFVVVAAASLIIVPFALRVRVPEDSPSPDVRRVKPLALDLLRSRPVAGAVLLGGTSFLMIGAFDVLWDVVHEDLATSTWMANLGITLFAIPLIVLGPIGGKLAQRIGPFRIGGAGLVGSAGFMALYGFLPTGAMIFAFSMGHALVNGIMIAAPGVAVGVTTPEDRQAGAQGLVGASQALMAAISSAVIGVVYETYGRAAAYSTAAVAMVVLVAIALWLSKEIWMGRGSETVAQGRVGSGPKTVAEPG